MSGKIFLGSVLVSIVSMSLITVIALPILYPNIQTIQPNQTGGILVQSKYMETSSLAQKTDVATLGTYVPDTEMNITIQEDSQIYAVFNSPYVLGVSDSLSNDNVSFRLSLSIRNSDPSIVGSRNARIFYFEEGTYTDAREFSSTVTMNYLSEELPAGVYNIDVTWASLGDRPGTNYLLFSTTDANATRSLFVQEFSN